MSVATIEGFRLSPQQRKVWLGQRGATAYRVLGSLRVEGQLDTRTIDRAVQCVVQRHEILRTRFQHLPGMDLPIQVIGDQAAFEHRTIDLRDAGAAEVEARFEELWREEQRAPFDVEQGPLLRSVLVTLSDSEHRLLVGLPALCADAVTFRNLMRGIAGAAGGQETEDDDEPVQYVDFAEWQNELLDGEDETGEEGRGYWREKKLAALPNPVLPFEDEPADPFDPQILILTLPPEVGDRLAEVERSLEIPTSTLLMTCLHVLVWRLTGQPRTVVARLFDGRSVEQLHGALGLFARYLPVDCRLRTGFRFHEAAAAVDATLKAHEAWQDLFSPEVTADAPAAGSPFFAIQFVDEEWPEAVTAGPLRISLERLYSCTERFTLKLCSIRREDRLDLELHYDPRGYPTAGARHFSRQLATILASVAENPLATIDEVEILGVDERRQLAEWNRTELPYPPEACAHQLFAERAAAVPAATAVAFEGEHLSYRELDRRSNQLARKLRALAVGPETPVALCLNRSIEMIVGLLGIWKSGGAYVPLDPALPAARLEFLLQDTGAPVLLTSERLASRLGHRPIRTVLLDADWPSIARRSDEPLMTGARPHNLAYVIYTSGSTGRPKGVMIRHGSLVCLVTSLNRAVYSGLDAPLNVSLNAPLGFDASVKQLLQLCQGHTLCILPEVERLDGVKLLEFVVRQKLDVLDLTPTLLSLLFAAGLKQQPELGPPQVLVGGEALDRAAWELMAASPRTDYYNVYGPTECTVDAAVCRVRDLPERPAIGRPVANARAYVCDQRLRRVAIGATGELTFAGPGLARGYLGRSAMTAEQFVPDPFGAEPGGRSYRTGDLARHLPDGELEFLGRVDHQVKIRGVRVELGEVESVLAEHPAVREAVAVVRHDDSAGERLVAYVVPHRRYAATVEGRARYVLPNGLAVVHQNRNETDYLYREIFEARSYLRHGLELPEDARVFDVGANIGLFTLFVNQLQPAARIYAFEPISPLFETLRINAELEAAEVKLFPVGLGDRDGAERFTFYPRYSMMSGLSDFADPEGEVAVIKRFLDNARTIGAAGAEVLLEHADELLEGRFEGETYEGRLRRLSDLIREESVERIDLLKIDVQRAELDVLRGIDEADWPRIQQIVMEVHDEGGPQGDDGRLAGIVRLLEDRGFEALTDQDELLVGTDRYMLYALRPGDGRRLRRDTDPHATDERRQPAPPRASLLQTSTLRDDLRSKLPETMVPAAFVMLDSLPVNPNGKVDRLSLPAPESLQPELRAEYVAPRSEVESTVAEIWQQALKVEKVGIHDNFFDLGGHSVLMVLVHNKLRQAFELDFSMLELFQHPTISSLAAFLRQETAASDPLAGVDRRARQQAAAVERQRQAMLARKGSHE